MKNNPAKNILFVLLGMFSAVSLAFSPVIFAPASTHATNSGVFPGDLNGDGAVNVLDLILLKLILLGETEPVKFPLLDDNSDVDQNGLINFIDNGALLDLIFGVNHLHGGGGGGGGGGNPIITPIPTPTPTPITWYRDVDGDGYGDPNSSVQSGAQTSGYIVGNSVLTQTVSQLSGYVTDNTDCDDSNSLVHPGATELCDGIDNNCDYQIDEGYPDLDQDGKADCVDPDDDGDNVADDLDCAPLDPNVWLPVTLYVDVDGDGYGTGDGQSMCIGDTLPTSYASKGGDCNDSNSLVHPGATELCDGIDNNCDYQIDEGYPDLDQDGKADCVDNDIDGDSVNNSVDCDPLDVTKWKTLTGFIDNDHDNYGTGPLLEVCSGESLPVGYASNDDDCDDTNAAVYPGAPEVCDGIDNNCDGKVDPIDGGAHHLGDNQYSGEVNSHFEMKYSEGTTYSRSFMAGSLQLYTKATLTITHRGVQKADPIKINGLQISSGWNSPSDGSLGTTTISFNISILQAGANTLTINASRDSGDYDDFEFNNIYITLSK